MAEPTAMQKRGLAKLGLAMPDGSYYIRNGSVGASDLQNAIDAVGRGEPQSSHNAIRVHIMKRAKALGLSDKIPANWQADGSLKHADPTETFLSHYGILGMRWGHHLPGVEALGGPGNSGGGSKPAPFIQPGDHTGDNSGGSGSSGSQDQSTSALDHQASQSVDFLSALRDHVAQETAASGAAAQDDNHPVRQAPPGSGASSAPAKQATASTPAKKQAAAVHAANKKHLAAVTQIHNKAQKAHALHKANKAKLKKHGNRTQAHKAAHAASKLHAAHMNHLKKTAQQAHQNHLAHIAKLKGKIHDSALNAQDKAALAKLSPAQRSALKKVPANLRAHAGNLTMAQKNKLRLTPAERTALSHLSPKQKAALAKATAASAKKRHEAAVARKAGQKIVSNPSVASARKATAAAAAKRTPAQQAAFNKLRLNAQNGTGHSMDDPVGTFLEHHGVKGMKWGIRRNGGHPGRIEAKVPVHSSEDHQRAQLIRAKVKAHGGVHALSNDELEALSKRLNLEAGYHRLNPQTGNLDKARSFVKTVTSDAKTVLDAVDTGRRVVKLASGDKKAA